MKHARKIVFYGFVASTLAVLIFAFWLFSRRPGAGQVAKAFPADSYEIFAGGKAVTLYSLGPKGAAAAADGEDFQGYAVSGKTDVKSESSRFLLKRSLLNAMASSETGAACFNPRHGLRVSDGAKTLDLVICFECGNFVSHYDGLQGEGSISVGLADTIYNQTLANAGIETGAR